MKLGYNKNFTLYLRKQYHPNTGTKLGKKVRKECKRKWGHLQLSVIEKKTLINQVMLSKILYLS